MKEFLKEMLIEPFKDGEWIGYIMGVLMWIVAISIFTILLFIGIWTVDSVYLPLQSKNGIVTKYYYRPSYYSTTYVMSGKVMIPITTHHSESFSLTIKIDDLSDDVSINKSYWTNVKIGDTIKCEYSKGRIRETLYIKNLK